MASKLEDPWFLRSLKTASSDSFLYMVLAKLTISVLVKLKLTNLYYEPLNDPYAVCGLFVDNTD